VPLPLLGCGKLLTKIRVQKKTESIKLLEKKSVLIHLVEEELLPEQCRRKIHEQAAEDCDNRNITWTLH
jgi:hypothetical protein